MRNMQAEDPIVVATVLRSGGEYTPDHVLKLRHAVSSNLHRPHRFVCLSDMQVPGIAVIPLVHSWPGWWSKIELFRGGIFTGRVVYLDLDTWITNAIDAICAWKGRFAMLSDFYEPEKAASGMMMWTPSAGTEGIYRRFCADSAVVMRNPGGIGDQAFIRQAFPGADRIQDLFPGKVVSWKVHCASAGIPPEAAVVCFHGPPRPWEVEDATAWTHAERVGRLARALEEEDIEAMETQTVDGVVSLTFFEVGPGRDLAAGIAKEIFCELGATETGFWVATYPMDRKAAA